MKTAERTAQKLPCFAKHHFAKPYFPTIIVSALTSKPVDTPSVIVHFVSSSGSDASASLTAGGDLRKYDEQIKMDDLIKLMPKPAEGIHSQWDPPINDEPIDVSDDDEAEVHMDTDDTILVSPLAFSKTLHISDLTNQILLHAQNVKLEEDKQGAEA
ncbi:hypothetical protein Tco_0024613 [Tanacetum coccineum]